MALIFGGSGLRKSDYLCSPELVNRWIERLQTRRVQLVDAAQAVGWTSAAVRTIRSAAVQYEAFGPTDRAPTWNGSTMEVVELRSAAVALRALLAEFD